jgi:hypothetical protein
MSFSKNKLRLAGSFAALLIFASALSCKGFFQNPTVSAITIDPPDPSVSVGYTDQLTAAATDSNGNPITLTGGTNCTGTTVCWSSSDTSIATISTGGLLTGVTQGTATITAASGTITATTTATIVLASVTDFEVCEGSFGATSSCSSGSTALVWNADANELVEENFIVQGESNGTEYDLTTAAIWTVVNAPSGITCDNSSSPAICTVDQDTTAGTYPVTITYGTNITATLNIVVTN